MTRETQDRWSAHDLKGRSQAELGDWYQPPPHYGADTSARQPERLIHYLERQRFGFVSPHKDANDLVRRYVAQHLGEDINPDDLLITTLYIDSNGALPHRANIAYSMTLTDAAIRNWQQNGNGQFLEHLSQLRDYREGGYPVVVSPAPLKLWDCFAYEAIYRKTSPQRFDHSTHVALDPKAFKKFVWDADLQAHYQRSVEYFWRDRRDTYHLLIKAALLKSAFVQYAEGSLIRDNQTLVLNALGLNPDQAWEDLTLADFTNAPLSSDFSFHQLVLYRYTATDIIVIKYNLTDELVVYIPGNSSPLHVFENLEALGDWVALQCKDPRRRQALESHFKLEDDPDGLWLSGIRTALAGLAVFPHYLNGATGYWRPAQVVQLSPALTPWPFSHIRSKMEERNVSDGRFLIRTRADYNKEAAAQSLTDAIMVTGGIAMVFPVLWAPLAAMSLALVGLGADEVIEGTSLEAQQQGVGRVVFGVLNAVPAAVEGASAVGGLLGSALRTEDEVAAGAADEIGQMVATRPAEQRSAAVAQDEEYKAQLAAEKQERTGESDADRDQRLEQEELRRQSQHAHHQSTYDSAIAFGVEPEGLRSLSPELRAELAKFEYNGPLDSFGSWGVDDFGAAYKATDQQTGRPTYIARVHAKIYRVERVEGAGRYRIFSPDDPHVKGPYIKHTKGYYSDIDLKPGLWGGESFIDVKPGASALPETAKPGIALAAGQDSPTVIEIPMDGIEVQPGFDDDYKPAKQYVLHYKGQKIRVRYDADQGCWQRNGFEFYWRDNRGVWKKGSETDFLKVRKKLNFGITSEQYEFPLLPGYPARSEPIELCVHYIWLGDGLPRAGLIDIMKANMKLSPNVKFMLHIDIDSNEILDELLPETQLNAEFAQFPNMTVSNLNEEPFFKDFTNQLQTAEPFHYFRHGEGKNLAAASDVLRYRLIHEYGGIYMDCDDAMKVSFDGAEIRAGSSDVLVGKIVTSSRAGFVGPVNSNFASLPGNPLLEEVQKELFHRFTAQRQALSQLKGAGVDPVTGLNPYMIQVFDVTGPRLFLSTLQKWRPDIGKILDGTLKPKWGIHSLTYREFVDDLRSFYAPFRDRLPIQAGSENSWIKPAGE